VGREHVYDSIVTATAASQFGASGGSAQSRRLASARVARYIGDLERSRMLLGEAVRLWRGRALADLAAEFRSVSGSSVPP
jgi:hypothetical protein